MFTIVLSIRGLVTAVVALVLFGGFAVTPSYGQASTNTTVASSFPFQSAAAPLCLNGEEFLISGNLHQVSHTTITPSGTPALNIGQLSLHATGTTSTGARVVITEADIQNVRQISPDQAELQVHIHGSIIIQGNTVNTVADVLIHETTNANGQVTAEVVRTDVRCVG